ncbi:glutamate ligase domain-containing protein, partial [Deinococcus pimensis]|uniref:glutamate ligase domain-containing protein n=1 Tax=Deinococcus pimensis TaxID=309888 RepID=UPI000483F65C
RLAAAEVPGGRFRVHPGPVTVIKEETNASPLSVKAALDALAAYPGRRVAVLGRMLELGEDERALHEEVGTHARARADVTYDVGEFAGLLGERAYDGTPELIPALLADLRPGDVVLVKASRGISWTPEERARRGVGLDDVVRALLEASRALG